MVALLFFLSVFQETGSGAAVQGTPAISVRVFDWHFQTVRVITNDKWTD